MILRAGLDFCRTKKAVFPSGIQTPQRKSVLQSISIRLLWFLTVFKEFFEHVVKFKYLVTTDTEEECLRKENSPSSTTLCLEIHSMCYQDVVPY